jgi:hypothetical protein
MGDIEYLEKHLDKLKKDNEKLSSEKVGLEKKLVSTETDNNDLLNKARELEYWADELKSKLDAALEENIILHNEADAYKAEAEEAIQRLQEEIEEFKNEVTSKEKIINRLTMHRDFLLKNCTKEDLADYNNLRSSGSFGKLNTPTPIASNSNTRVSEKFMQSYSKTLFNTNIDSKGFAEDTSNTTSFFKRGSIDKSDGDNDDKDDTEFIRQKIDAEIKNILDNRRNFILNTLTQENFSFDVISGIDNLGANVTVFKKNNNKAMNVKVIDDILSKVQARKDKILSQKKLMQTKLEKIGIKIC